MNETPYDSLEDTIQCGFDDAGLSLEDAARERLTQYASLIQKWNRAVRLVGDAHAEQITFHIVDSAVLLRLPLPEIPWVDVGSGAGFPGLVLACLRPDQPIILVEPRERRAVFLGQVVKALALQNVTVKRARLEEITIPDPALVVAKALAPPEEFLKMAKQAQATFTCVMTNKDGVPSLGDDVWEEIARSRHQTPGHASRINLLYQRRTESASG